jgi:hypothetical protein
MKNFFEKPIFDPRNPVWLEILRYIVITGALFILFAGILYAIVDSMYLVSFIGRFSNFILVSVLSIAASFTYHIIGMVSLNLLYNVQEIRRNTINKTK